MILGGTSYAHVAHVRQNQSKLCFCTHLIATVGIINKFILRSFAQELLNAAHFVIFLMTRHSQVNLTMRSLFAKFLIPNYTLLIFFISLHRNFKLHKIMDDYYPNNCCNL